MTLALLDEAMAWACIAIGRRWAVTTETTTRFDRPVLVDTPHVIEAAIASQDDRLIHTTARVLDSDAQVCAEATATFTILGEAQVQRIVGSDEPLDESLLNPADRTSDSGS